MGTTVALELSSARLRSADPKPACAARTYTKTDELRSDASFSIAVAADTAVGGPSGRNESDWASLSEELAVNVEPGDVRPEAMATMAGADIEEEEELSGSAGHKL